MAEVEIASASLGDLDDIVPLWSDLVRDQRSHGTYLVAGGNVENARSWLATQLTFDGIRVARSNGDIVGFVAYELMRDQFDREGVDGIIQNLYVAPAYRDQAIGSRLLHRAESVLRDRGVDRIRLQVLDENRRATAFYEDRGYDSYRTILRKSFDQTDTNNADDDES